MEFFDSHAHYNDEKFNNDRKEILQKIYKENITRVIVAGYNLQSSKEAVKIANEYNYIYAICGVSPNDIGDNLELQIKEIANLCKENKKIVAIGEIGLDYYWNKENKAIQKLWFRKQIELANELNLPIVIHSRDASADTISVLQEQHTNKNGVFHCCQLNKELIKGALNLGFYLSFAGPITYKNSKNAEEIIQMVPIDRILIETDSPYLSPEPFRGTRNNSINVKLIAQKIAQIKNMSLEEVASITYNNAKMVFNIK